MGLYKDTGTRSLRDLIIDFIKVQRRSFNSKLVYNRFRFDDTRKIRSILSSLIKGGVLKYSKVGNIVTFKTGGGILSIKNKVGR